MLVGMDWVEIWTVAAGMGWVGKAAAAEIKMVAEMGLVA